MPERRNSLTAIRSEVQRLANPVDAAFLQRFFKTGPGEYGEGDRFLGIRVPAIRSLARSHRSLPREERLELLHSPWHEERMLALLLMVEAFSKSSPEERKQILDDYLRHTSLINNWDLVDLSAYHIVGPFSGPGNIKVIRALAKSRMLWERRIAIVSTYHWIRRKEFIPTITISRALVNDPHDLIHKAVGWMLREVGKRDQEVEETFLREHCRIMPRTMLRYAIERFPAELRKAYMQGK